VHYVLLRELKDFFGGKTMKRIVILALCVFMLAGALWAGGKNEAAGGSENIKISLITMDYQDEHWLKLAGGAQDKAREIGNVDVNWMAPQMGKRDVAGQMQLIEDAITRKYQAILLAPLDADALVPAIERAYDAGVKIILVDSNANTQKRHTLIGTDNGAAARLAADEMAKVINNTGKIAVINAQPGAGTTMTRENEFKAQIASKYPNIQIVGTQYSDGDPVRALNQATDFMTANPDLVGIYACNEGSTVGAGQGIEQAGRAGRVHLIGWDWTANTLGLVQRGVQDASMVQNPREMGVLGVQYAVDLINGKSIPADADSGVIVANRSNYTTIQ
jgi:ribose transport system substrate-binding protein